MGTLGGMVASALAAASFGRRRRREVLEDDGELDLMARVDKGVEEIVNEMEGRQELGMLEGMLNRFWNIFTLPRVAAQENQRWDEGRQRIWDQTTIRT